MKLTKALLGITAQLDRNNLADRMQLADIYEENDCGEMAALLRDTSDLWVWMPHPAHFICARYCKFFLATYLPSPGAGEGTYPGYIVSTVGEYLMPEAAWDAIGRLRGIDLPGLEGDAREAAWIKLNGYEDIGWNRKYETMVFAALPREPRTPEYQCCPWEIDAGRDVDTDGYNDPTRARDGHLALCRKWSAEPAMVRSKAGHFDEE